MINSFKREKLMVAANLSIMTITFLVLGLFISLVVLSQTAIRNLERQAQITLFFEDEFPESSIFELQEQLKMDERIAETIYVSKEDAFAIFTELNKDDPVLLESITPSILPASLEVKTVEIDNLAPVADELNQIDGVEEVKFFRDVIEKFKYWSNLVYTMGLVLVLIFLVISFSVVVVSLRITINSKGKELEILKLVGASDDYVRKPLMKQGIFFGVVSAMIASTIIIGFSLLLQMAGFLGGNVQFALLPDVYLNITVFTLLLSFVLIASGFILGFFGSLTAIKKYLKY